MATIDEIKQQAEAVKNATQVGENTAMRVGGALAGLADIAKQQDVELGKKADKETVDTELGKKLNTSDFNTKLTEEKKRVDTELGKKFDKTSVAQESGDSEELVMSQKTVSDKLSDLSTIFPTLFINVGSTFKSPFKNLSIEGLEYTEGIFLRQFDYKSSDSFDIVLTLGNVNGKNLTFSIAKDNMTTRSGKVILDKVVVYFTLADFIQEKYHFFTDNSDDNSNYICPSVFTIENINKENIKTVSDKLNYITEIMPQYKDAKVLMFGDSFIDYGAYPTAVQNLLKCNIINRGVGGSTIVRRTDKPNQSLICRLFNEDAAISNSGNGQSLPESCDVVIVHAGVNDFVQAKELGSIDLGMSDDSKIYSAIQVILYNLIKKYPNAKIIWDTPCHFKSRASDNKDFYYDESKNLVEVRKSCTLKEIAIAIKECCALYGVKVADMYSESGICPELEENSVLYTKDGLHPSELGAKKLAKILAKEL